MCVFLWDYTSNRLGQWWLRYMERSLKSYVVVIPKEGQTPLTPKKKFKIISLTSFECASSSGTILDTGWALDDPMVAAVGNGCVWISSIGGGNSTVTSPSSSSSVCSPVVNDVVTCDVMPPADAVDVESGVDACSCQSKRNILRKCQKYISIHYEYISENKGYLLFCVFA